MSNAIVRREDWESRIRAPGFEPRPEPGEEDRVATGRGALRTRDHAAIVYWERGELLASIVPYLIEGLRAGDKVFYVADDNEPSVILEALRREGIDVDRETASGRLTVVAAKDAFFGDGKFDVEAALKGVQELASAAERDGYRRVRFSVEMTYLLAKVPGIERGPEFESRANEEVFARFPFVCICSFNGSRNANGVLEEVLATHPVLISEGIPLANPYYRSWLELRARNVEVDAANTPPAPAYSEPA